MVNSYFDDEKLKVKEEELFGKNGMGDVDSEDEEVMYVFPQNP